MTLLRWLLAALLVAAGVSHLTWGRRGYRIVVPEWATRMLRTDKDAIGVGSGTQKRKRNAKLIVLVPLGRHYLALGAED